MISTISYTVYQKRVQQGMLDNVPLYNVINISSDGKLDAVPQFYWEFPKIDKKTAMASLY